MSDVSCRAFDYFEQAAELLDVPVARLIEGSGLTLDYLRQAGNWAPWDSWSVLCENTVALAGSRERAVHLSDGLADQAWVAPMRALLTGVASPAVVYRATRDWFGPFRYRNVTTEMTWLDGRRLHVVVRLREQDRGCQAFFVLAEGGILVLPTLIGLQPAALLDGEITPHMATWTLLMPPSRTVWSRLLSVPKVLLSTRAVLAEMGEMQRTVTDSHEALLRSERDYHSVLDALPGGVAIENQGRTEWCNQAWRAMFPSQASWVDHVVDDDRPTAEAVRDRRREVAAVRVSGASGGPVRWVEISAPMPVRFEGADAVLVRFNDVTELRELERQMWITDRLAAMGTLAAGVAHEVNNPLTYVLDSLDQLSVSPDQDTRRLALHARRGAHQVRLIMQDLLALAREGQEQPTLVRVVPVLQAMARMNQARLRMRGTMVWDVDTVPPVMATETRVAQVFLNLLVNAVQALPPGDPNHNQVGVNVRSEGGEVLVEVWDTGPGIPPEVHERLFEPFFTTKEPGEGTGIGLSVCKGIVEGYGGRIEVASAPGGGALFRVRLPAADAADDTPVPAPTEGPDRRLRVLVVDDEPMVAEVTARFLHMHDVTVVASGQQALDAVGAGAFDVIICDLTMPDISGMDVHGALVERDPALAARVVFVTGGAFEERTRTFLETIDNPVLHKPFRRDDLLASIATLVG